MGEETKSRTSENVVVFVIIIGIIIGCIATFGWTSVKNWISEPLKWKEPKGITITYLGSDLGTWGYNLHFDVENNTDTDITEYNFIVDIGDSSFEVYESFPEIQAHSSTLVAHSAAKTGYGAPAETDYDKFADDLFTNNDATIKVKKLYSHKDKVFSNNGYVKDLIIIIISAFFGLLGFFMDIKFAPLRVFFKLLGAPGIIVSFVLFLLFAIIGGGAGRGAVSEASDSADNAAKQRAKERYKQAAQHKAGYEQHGNTREAARQQRIMDEALADMITGSKNSVAKESYKRHAAWEAGAKASGNYRDAARANAAKERNFADLLSDAAKDD